MSDLGNREVMAQNIKYYMKLYGKSRTDVCKDLHFSYTTFSDWVNAKKYPRIDKIEMMAYYFNVSKSDLVERKDNYDEIPLSIPNVRPIEIKRLPLLGSVSCGQPIYANEERESYVMVGTNVNVDFCLVAKGDSMINARINDGDIVFVRRQSSVENGEIAVVLINDEATLKRFYLYKDKLMVILRAENPKYEDIIFVGEELKEIKILGKAIFFQSDIE